jgi:hypothetical protein
VGHGPLLQQIGNSRELLTRQFGAASRLRPPTQSVVSSRVDSPCCSRAMAVNRRASNSLGSRFTYPKGRGISHLTKMGVSRRQKKTARTARIPLRSGNPIRPYTFAA